MRFHPQRAHRRASGGTCSCMHRAQGVQADSADVWRSGLGLAEMRRGRPVLSAARMTEDHNDFLLQRG